MLWLAVLWSYVTDAALMLRRWRNARREQDRRLPRECQEYRHPETVQEWFNRTEGKTK